MQKAKSLLKKFLIWRIKHVSDYQFNLFLSVIIGFAAGLAAVVIKNAVHFIRNTLELLINKEYHNYIYFAYPLIGISLAIIFAKYILKRRVGHGIPSVLYAISKEGGYIRPHNMFSSIITSSFTVGFGGSVGLEGPTVATGGALGSNIARFLHLNYKNRILMLGCASAGAMAAIFKAPIAAIVFALEVIMLDLTMTHLVPLLMASATAALTSYFFLGKDVLYPFTLKDPFLLKDIPYYIAIAIITGLISVYFTKVYIFIHEKFEKIQGDWKKLFIGGSVLGLLIFIIPAFYGEGYNAINSALHGDYSYLFDGGLFYSYKNSFTAVVLLLAAVVLIKVVATSVTFASGGVGGIFAPTLFMGANLGLLFAILNNSVSAHYISPSNFALVGMAGTIAGVLHAPLTAIFLIAEITRGYDLFMPLMIVATISYATTKYFVANSVYTYQLAERGELMTHHADKNILSMMKIEKLIERNFATVHIDGTLRDVVKAVSKSSRNIFPVIDDDNNFYGIITLDVIRNIMFKPEMYDKVKVRDLMFTPSVVVSMEDSMEEVAQKFHKSGKYNIAVIENGKYKGFVSRARVFSAYRRMLRYFSED